MVATSPKRRRERTWRWLSTTVCVTHTCRSQLYSANVAEDVSPCRLASPGVAFAGAIEAEFTQTLPFWSVRFASLIDVSWFPCMLLWGERVSFSLEPLMPKSRCRTSLVVPRSHAFARQGGRCIYCGVPMCVGDLDEFAAQFGISAKQALKLKCTGEHLQPHCEGGTSASENIAAACWHCNRLRHSRPRPPSFADYRQLVRSRMRKCKWHEPWVFERVIVRAD